MSIVGSIFRRAGHGISRSMLRTDQGPFTIHSTFSSSPKPTVPMSVIKDLRIASGAPILDCKKALEAEDVAGDVTKAFEWLRKKGMAKATSMADRSANEGLVGLQVDGSRGALVEVNSETDFVARNERFQAFVSQVLSMALASSTEGVGAGMGDSSREINVEELMRKKVPGEDETLGETLADLVGVIRENITLRRAQVLLVQGGEGLVAGYVHGAVAPGMGKSGALVALGRTGALGAAMSSGGSREEGEAGGGGAAAALESLEAEGRSLAMHIVATRPQFLDEASAPTGVLEREKEVLMEQAASTGKNPKFLGKMVEGRLRKFLEEKALLCQSHMVAEGNPRVSDHLERVGKALGGDVTLQGFVRFSVGDGEV